MNILGLNCYLHDSSAALFQDGRLIFAAEEERFSRIRKDGSFPRLAIKAGLDYAGLAPGDIDAIAFGWNRAGVTQLHTLRSMITGGLPMTPRMAADVLLAGTRELIRGNGRRTVRRFFHSASTPVFFIDHHLAHAWSAYAYSGFDDALVMVADARGAFQATTLYHGRLDALKRIKTINWPNSLGAFYEAFTDLLGFERYFDEWKLMGLAAYGEPDRDMSQFIEITPGGGYRVNAHLVYGTLSDPTSRLERILGPRRQPEVLITDEDRNLAASVQKAAEDAMFSVVREGIRLTGCRRLCLAGGVALNSKANGRLLASGLVDEIFVQPAAADDGTAVGAGLVTHQLVGKDIPRERLTDVYLGPEFLQEDLAEIVRTYKLRAHTVTNLEAQVASVLAAGAIVGWFQGRMEFGPRALGNRSILADPTRNDMKDLVNNSVKFRESWRPFAPSCLAESAGEYFVGATDAAFMTVTFEVRADKRQRIPAVTHFDQTARIQTVSRESNPRYWRLIKEFERKTGVPVIMNTSFNLRGEPIVCTPKDAVRTFYSSGLDFLVLGDFLIAKDPAWSPEPVSAREPVFA